MNNTERSAPSISPQETQRAAKRVWSIVEFLVVLRAVRRSGGVSFAVHHTLGIVDNNT
jgi:hypothetical protein